MVDFGSKDFGNVLKKLFEEEAPEDVKQLGAEDEFSAESPDARQAFKLGQEELTSMQDQVQASLKEFAKYWGPFKKVLRKSHTVVAQLQQYSDNTNKTINNKGVSDDEASSSLFGGNKADLAAREKAYGAAPDERTVRADDKVSAYGKQDFVTGDTGKQTPYGDTGREQQRLASMQGQMRKRLPGQRTRQSVTPVESVLSDFSDLLSEMVEQLNEVKTKATTTPATGSAASPMPEEAAKPKSFRQMIKTLRNFTLEIDQQVKILDEKIQPALKTVQSSVGAMQKTFRGLAHLTKEQQDHIMELTKKANARIKKLQESLKPLKGMKNDTVASLQQQVQTLTGELEKKEAQMQVQEQDYEDLLDYYEEIMLKMKKAQLQAERELANAEAELAGGVADHVAPEPVVEHIKPLPESKPEKTPDFQNYGTFDLTEHLEKARKTLPKATNDW